MAAHTKPTSERTVQLSCCIPQHLREALRLAGISPSQVLREYAERLIAVESHLSCTHPPTK